jgi:hypothetical protein
MNVTGGSLSSTSSGNNNTNAVVTGGGRKTTISTTIISTTESVEGEVDAVIVNVENKNDDAVVADVSYLDEVVSLDSEEESDDEELTEEESESEEESDEEEDAELDEGLAERLRILADARALKSIATAFLHPEVGVKTNGLMARCFYDRASAPTRMEDEEADEIVDIMEDAKALKAAAKMWLHPEEPVKVVDATVFGRNYFNRASAPEVESVEEANERARVLADAKALKANVVAWTHPEIGVKTSDPFACGRNYFERASAPETEEDEYADERADALADAAALKSLAVDYRHPEVGVTTTDGTACGRNYFNRNSAPEVEDLDDAAECARVMADVMAMKKNAVDYLHPEVGVVTSDPTACGRNYFDRASAPETDDVDEANERAAILADALALKKSAVDYLHPEVGVVTSDGTACGRNYFNRYSAPEVEDIDEANERAAILAEAASLKKQAIDFMHPERPVEVDANAFGRNYFTRYSSPLEYEHEIIGYKDESDEEEPVSDEQKTLESLAAAVKGANLPSTKNAKLSSADGDFTATKKSASSVNLFGLTEEVV